MCVPIQLSSEPEQCLRELISKRDKLLNELRVYKETKANANKPQAKSAAQPAAGTFEKKTEIENQPINSFSDTKSESSCLDSNYESDNNNNSTTGASSVIFSLLEDENVREEGTDFRRLHSELHKLSFDHLDQEKSIKNSVILTNSDDSDVTINDVPILTKKKMDIKTFFSRTASSDELDACKTPTDTTSPHHHLHDNNNNDDLKVATEPSDQKPTMSLMRQFSDGYCSSYTPLSASSINSEHPAKNPFFQTSQINDHDVETCTNEEEAKNT
jgi:hypothetical protein